MGPWKRALLLGPLAAIGIVLVLAPDHRVAKWLIAGAIAALALGFIVVRDLAHALPFSSIEFAGVKLSLPDVELQKGEEEEGEQPKPTRVREDVAARWREIRWKLEAKLTYLAKHTLPDHLHLIDPRVSHSGGNSSFLTIGSLRYDKLLTDTDAEIATNLLALSPTDLALADPSSLEKLLDEAAKLTRVIRSRVFASLVDQFLTHRGFVLVGDPGVVRTYTLGGEIVTVRAAFSTVRGPIAATASESLPRDDTLLRVVAVPKWPGRHQETSESSNGVWIVPLDHLDALLSASQRASAGPDVGDEGGTAPR